MTKGNHIKTRIFLVEDDQKNMKLFRAILNTISDCEIIMEEKGQIALEKIKNQCPLELNSLLNKV